MGNAEKREALFKCPLIHFSFFIILHSVVLSPAQKEHMVLHTLE